MSVTLADGHEPVAMIAIGYPGDQDLLQEPYRTREFRPRERKPAKEIVYKGIWNRPSDWFDE